MNILKTFSGLCIDQITLYIDKMFEYSEFPNQLNRADVSPIFKANDSALKVNFRPISVVPALSKVFELIMAKKMTPLANTRLSSLLCGFRNGYSTQYALFRLIEVCSSTLAKKGYVEMVLIDLSKLGLESLKLFSSYLSSRKQRVKYGNSFSEWLNKESGPLKVQCWVHFCLTFL